MFKCGNCKQIVQPRQPQFKQVVESVPVVYATVGKRTQVFRPGTPIPAEANIISRGTEIIKEIGVCADCAQ